MRNIERNVSGVYMRPRKINVQVYEERIKGRKRSVK